MKAYNPSKSMSTYDISNKENEKEKNELFASPLAYYMSNVSIYDIKIVETMLENGANPNLRDERGFLAF